MITFRSREKLRYQELWFDEPEGDAIVDVVVRNQSISPEQGKRNEEFHTLLIDLTPELDAIWLSFDRNTRSQIRVAELDKSISIEILERSTYEQFVEFLDFYDDFSRSKSIWPIWVPRLKSLHASGQLVLSRVIRNKEALVWHACLKTSSRFVVLYSASRQRTDSSLRKVIGQANRLLHWREMQCLREQGCLIYDFCGWYAGVDDKALLLVNRFKEEFGGRKVVEYNILEDRTFQAKIIRALKFLSYKIPKKYKVRWQRIFA